MSQQDENTVFEGKDELGNQVEQEEISNSADEEILEDNESETPVIDKPVKPKKEYPIDKPMPTDGLVIGAAIGLTVGIIVGFTIDQIPLSISAGVLICSLVGIFIDSKRAKKAERQQEAFANAQEDIKAE